jgi:hypothetical protein
MMRNWFSLLISTVLWAGSAQALPPERVEITYEIARNGTALADMLHVIEHNGSTYQITESWKGRGILSLRGTAIRISRGMVTPDGLRPIEFIDQRSGRSTATAKFDWQAKTVTMQYGGEPRTEPLPAQAHDRLAFGFDFAFAPPRTGQVAFDLLDGRGLSRHVYTVGGRDRLTTPAGEFEVLKVIRGTEDDRTEIWLATNRSYLPVRILVVEKNGTTYDQVATKITQQ